MDELLQNNISNHFLAMTAYELYQSYLFDEVHPILTPDPGLLRCAEYVRSLYDSSEHQTQNVAVTEVAQKLKEIYCETHGDDDGLDLVAHSDHPLVWDMIARWMSAALHAETAEEAVQFAADLVQQARRHDSGVFSERQAKQ